jgi:hypothetical protein
MEIKAYWHWIKSHQNGLSKVSFDEHDEALFEDEADFNDPKKYFDNPRYDLTAAIAKVNRDFHMEGLRGNRWHLALRNYRDPQKTHNTTAIDSPLLIIERKISTVLEKNNFALESAQHQIAHKMKDLIYRYDGVPSIFMESVYNYDEAEMKFELKIMVTPHKVMPLERTTKELGLTTYVLTDERYVNVDAQLKEITTAGSNQFIKVSFDEQDAALFQDETETAPELYKSLRETAPMLAKEWVYTPETPEREAFAQLGMLTHEADYYVDDWAKVTQLYFEKSYGVHRFPLKLKGIWAAPANLVVDYSPQRLKSSLEIYE